MLKFFEIEATFNKLTARLYVDCASKTASITMTYDRLIVATGELGVDQHITKFGQDGWVKLTDVNGAEKFLSRDMGERGNFMEAMEHYYRVLASRAA